MKTFWLALITLVVLAPHASGQAYLDDIVGEYVVDFDAMEPELSRTRLGSERLKTLRSDNLTLIFYKGQQSGVLRAVLYRVGQGENTLLWDGPCKTLEGIANLVIIEPEAKYAAGRVFVCSFLHSNGYRWITIDPYFDGMAGRKSDLRFSHRENP